MDLLTIISACTVARDFSLVFTMVIVFSNGNAFMVKDAAEIETPPLYDPYDLAEGGAEDPERPRTRGAALAKVARLRAAGRSPLVGLLPVPPSWAANFQRKTSELLDACTNISVGSAMLAQFEYECGRASDRECVLERYARAAGIDAFADDVLEAIRTYGYPERGAVVIETEAVFSSPIHAAKSASRGWGADTIFFTTQLPNDVPSRGGGGRRTGREVVNTNH